MKINRRFFVSILGALVPGVLLGGDKGKKYGYIVGTERCDCLDFIFYNGLIHHASCPVKNYHYEPYDSIVYKTKYEAECRVNLLNSMIGGTGFKRFVAKKVEVLEPMIYRLSLKIKEDEMPPPKPYEP